MWWHRRYIRARFQVIHTTDYDVIRCDFQHGAFGEITRQRFGHHRFGDTATIVRRSGDVDGPTAADRVHAVRPAVTRRAREYSHTRLNEYIVYGIPA